MGPFPCSFQRSKPRQIFTMSVFESYWANKAACDDAERAYYEKLSGCKGPQGAGKKMGLTEQIDQARQLIKNSLECVSSIYFLYPKLHEILLKPRIHLWT